MPTTSTKDSPSFRNLLSTAKEIAKQKIVFTDYFKGVFIMDKKCRQTASTLTLPIRELSVEDEVRAEIMIIDNSEKEIEALSAKIAQLKTQKFQIPKCLK